MALAEIAAKPASPEAAHTKFFLFPLSSSAKRSVILFISLAIALLYLAARLRNLTTVCLDGDEIFSLLLARGSWAELMQTAIRDSVHPPLFYLLLKSWTALFGASLLALRALPCLLALLAALPFLGICRELRMTAAERLLAFLLVAVHPFLIYYAVQVRMYSLLLLLGSLSIALFLKTLREDSARTWILLTTVNIGLVYSHYYGLLLIVVEVACTLLWNRRKMLHSLLSTSAVAAAFLPWVLAVVQAIAQKGGLIENLGWVPRPDLAQFVWFLDDILGIVEFDRLLYVREAVLLLALIALFLGVRHICREESSRKKPALTLTMLAFAPPMLTFAASISSSSSIWGHRHLIFTAPAFLALLVMAMGRAPRWLQIALSAALTLYLPLAVVNALSVDDRRLAWDQLTAQIAQAELSSSSTTSRPTAIYGFDNASYPIAFYLNTLQKGETDLLGSAVRARIATQKPPAGLFRIVPANHIAEAQGSYFWVGYTVPNWAVLPEQSLADRGCRVGAAIEAADKTHRYRFFPVWCGDR